MSSMSVKDVVRRTGFSRETLRYYENAGLLPKPARSRNGYRRFRATDLERLEFIRKTKKAGFKLREIRELISIKDRGKATCRVGRDIARARIAGVDAQIASLREVREILRDSAKRCEEEGLNQPCSLSFNCSPPGACSDCEPGREEPDAIALALEKLREDVDVVRLATAADRLSLAQCPNTVSPPTSRRRS